MAKKTTAKPIVKAKAKKPAPKTLAKKPVKPVKKAAPAPKAVKPVKPAAAPAAKKGKATPAKPKAAPAKPAPAKTFGKEAKKAPVQPAKPAEKKPAGKISVTKPDSNKANSMSSTATSKASGKTSTPVAPVGKAAKPKGKTSSAHDRNFAPYELKKGEEYMNERQKDHFKRILLHWRDELMQEVDRTVHNMQDEAANPPDPADRATLEEEFSIELRTRDRERRLIKKIDSTIELIANDDYGYCDSCGVEIGIRRLEARPTANKCIDCKTLDEIKEKQLGSP